MPPPFLGHLWCMEMHYGCPTKSPSALGPCGARAPGPCGARALGPYGARALGPCIARVLGPYGARAFFFLPFAEPKMPNIWIVYKISIFLGMVWLSECFSTQLLGPGAPCAQGCLEGLPLHVSCVWTPLSFSAFGLHCLFQCSDSTVFSSVRTPLCRHAALPTARFLYSS